MACEAGEAAVQKVFGSSDLVALILGKLPMPWLSLNTSFSTRSDRLAASLVNRVFRRAALRLPWGVQWGWQHDQGGKPCSKALAMLRSRSVQALTVFLASRVIGSARFGEAIARSAAVLHYARSTEHFVVCCDRKGDLSKWLRHTMVPLPQAVHGPHVGTSVLACLASLSRLTSLGVSCDRWSDASWLTLISQLKSLTLLGYSGPPLSGLPALESLYVGRACAQTSRTCALEDWSSPRLTSLYYVYGCLRLGSPLGGHLLQGPTPSNTGSMNWRSRLQHLELSCCPLSPHDTGFKEVLPGLTHLKLSWQGPEQESLAVLLSKGLPMGLKALALHGPKSVWPAVFELHCLEVLVVWQSEKFLFRESAAVVADLTRLPQLKHVHFRLPVSNSDEARVEEGFEALKALLLNRQGCLRLELHCS